MSSLAATVQDIFDEPGCAKNGSKSEAERRNGCTRQLQPGSAAGGCAFDGAKVALQPFTDVAHLVHGPIACEGNSWDNRGAASSGSDLWRTAFTTDLSETDIVFGGEKRLCKAIKEIIDKCDPPAIFVYQTCIPAMIGDDINAVCKAASRRFSKPVIPINSPGFAGSKNLGNKLAGEALLDYVIGTREPDYTTPYDINLIGEYNPFRRALAGEASVRRAWSANSLLHFGRWQIPRSRFISSRAGGNVGVLKIHDQRGTQDGATLRDPILRGVVLRYSGFKRIATPDRPLIG
ncbi:nitrogenase molybdenum-iron protein alpha/beta subunit [Bradyrhizobium diazoefficiens]